MMNVSELLAVKIELTAIKLQQLTAAHAQLVAEQRALVDQARAEVGVPVDYVYNTDTRAFQPPVPLSAPAARQAKRVAKP